MDIYARGIMRYELAPSPDIPLHVEAAFHHLPELGLARVSASAASAHRARHHLSGDDLVLNVGLSGMRSIRQCGREAVTGRERRPDDRSRDRIGHDFDLAVHDLSRAGQADGGTRPQRARMLVRPIPRNTAPLRLLIGYAGGLQHPGTLATPALRRLAATHVHDLVALTLGATRDAAATARLRGARAARLQAIKADIRQNLAKDLSVAALAARHRLPVRSLQRLFEADGVTFTDFVLAERLVARAPDAARHRACRTADQHDRVRLRLPAYLLFQSRLPHALRRFPLGRTGAAGRTMTRRIGPDIIRFCSATGR